MCHIIAFYFCVPVMTVLTVQAYYQPNNSQIPSTVMPHMDFILLSACSASTKKIWLGILKMNEIEAS